MVDSIKNKTRRGIITLVIVLSIIISAAFMINSEIESKYEETLDNFILEYKLLEANEKLVSDYYSASKGISTQQLIDEYQTTKDKLIAILKDLENEITYSKSKVKFSGIQSLVYELISITDEGVRVAKEGSIDSLTYYHEANKILNFIDEVSTDFLQSEMEYIAKEKIKIDNLVRINSLISIILAGLVLFSTLILASEFVKSIVNPITNLSTASKNISKGDFNIKINKQLTKEDDEIGVLYTSFSKMVAKIKSQITKLKKSKEELTEANEELKVMNQIREEFNTKLEAEVKQRTKELQKAYTRIENLLEQKTRFIGQVAHDLRTPLTPMGILIPMIKKRLVKSKCDKEVLREIDVIMGNMNDLKKLVDNTLSISKLDTECVLLDLEEIKIQDMIEEVISGNKDIIKKSKVKIVSKVNEKTPAVLSDKKQFIEICKKIIDNCIKFMPNKKVITIKTKHDKNYVFLYISDTGIGIPQKYLKKVFDVFYKVDKSRHEAAASCGIGLSIAEKLTKLMKGKIWAESKGEGKGTTIVLQLKRFEKVSKPKSKSKPKPISVKKTTKK